MISLPSEPGPSHHWGLEVGLKSQEEARYCLGALRQATIPSLFSRAPSTSRIPGPCGRGHISSAPTGKCPQRFTSTALTRAYVAQIPTLLFKATPSLFLSFVASVSIREIVSLKDSLYSFLKRYIDISTFLKPIPLPAEESSQARGVVCVLWEPCPGLSHSPHSLGQLHCLEEGG